jgi:hypothetical protein
MTEIVDEDDRVWHPRARAKVAEADVKVGDRVREVRADGKLGRYGTLASIDRSDPENTFGVELEEGFRWLRNVRGEPTDEAESLESARTTLDASQAENAQMQADLNASHAARDALTARVETLNEKVAALETRLRTAEDRQSNVRLELSAFRRAVSEKAYEIVDDGEVPCREGMEQWLRDNDCPVKTLRTSGTVTIQFDLRDIVVPEDVDPSDGWLQDLVSRADLNVDVDCDVSDWRIESTEIGDVESEWQ